MADYTHRIRVDGRWDSICMVCYQTAATAMREPELKKTEAKHKCRGCPQTQLIAQVADFLRQRAD
jgi:hypothetical protein